MADDEVTTGGGNKLLPAAWIQNYQRLADFQRVHGHCNVPRKGEYFYLAKWVGRQRHRLPQLSTEQKELMEQIGFPFHRQNPHEAAWMEKLERLKAYKKNHGDCLVPQVYNDDPELGTWVANQRRVNNRGKMRDDRKEMLLKVGFDFKKPGKKRTGPIKYDKRMEKWEEMFLKLQTYAAKHGHCSVPYQYSDEDSSSLGMWVSTQRRNFKDTMYHAEDEKLREDQKRRLDQLGFVWDASITEQGQAKKDDEDDSKGGIDSEYQLPVENGLFEKPSTMEQQLALVRAQHEELQDQIEHVQSHNRNLLEEKDQLWVEKERLAAENEFLRIQNRTLRTQQELLHTKNRKLAGKKELLRMKNKNLRQRIPRTPSSTVAQQEQSSDEMVVTPSQQGGSDQEKSDQEVECSKDPRTKPLLSSSDPRSCSV